MRRRDLAFGVVLVAAIAAGAYVAGRPHGTRGADQTTSGDSAELPNLSLHDVRLEVDDVAVRVAVASRPVLAFEKNQVFFRFEGVGEDAGQPVAVEDAAVSFTMKMDMGMHRYALVPGPQDGWLQAELVLPACPSGNRRWYGNLTFAVSGRPLRTSFQLDLEPRAN
jgi:hypothetical protein